MENNKLTPETIDRTFSIPLYQRLFSWKEENVKKLLSDMKEHFENKLKKEKPYYLGMLTCKDEELIDGQQRMTVMMLMAIVMKEYYNDWNKFLNGNRIKFTARSDDQEYIQKMIETVKKDGEIVDPEGYVNYNMKSALETIKKFMNENFENDKEREVFTKNVYERLTFFIAELPENYGRNDRKSEVLLNKYFEAMNSAGRNLEQHEILKVELLNKIEGKTEEEKMKKREMMTKIWNLVSWMERPVIIQQEKTTTAQYQREYKKIIKLCLEHNEQEIESFVNKFFENIKVDGENEETIGGITANEKPTFKNHIQTEGSDSIISFEDFLLMVLDITKNNEKEPGKITVFYQKEKLLERFKDLIDSTFSEEIFYNNLLLYRLLLDYYVIRRKFDGGEVKEYSLIVRDEKYESGDNVEKDIVKKLSQYQSMLYVSTEFYRWLKPFLLKVKEVGCAITTVDMLNYLKSQDNLRHDHVPDDMSFNSIDRYWFWRLDYYLWENRKGQDWYEVQKEAVDNFIFRANRSVEHFYPQDQNQQDRPWNNDIIDINSFGNLALISVSFNSQQNNDHMRLKMARIESHIGQRKLQSLKLLRMYLDAKNGNDGWTEAKADKHGKEMLEILKKSYE